MNVCNTGHLRSGLGKKTVKKGLAQGGMAANKDDIQNNQNMLQHQLNMRHKRCGHWDGAGVQEGGQEAVALGTLQLAPVRSDSCKAPTKTHVHRTPVPFLSSS